MHIGEYIKKERKKQSLSGRELSRRSGISQGYLSQLETGKNQSPTFEAIRKLANGLGIDYTVMIESVYDIDMNQIKNEAMEQTKNRINNIPDVLDLNEECEKIIAAIRFGKGDILYNEKSIERADYFFIASVLERLKKIDLSSIDEKQRADIIKSLDSLPEYKSDNFEIDPSHLKED